MKKRTKQEINNMGSVPVSCTELLCALEKNYLGSLSISFLICKMGIIVKKKNSSGTDQMKSKPLVHSEWSPKVSTGPW